MISRFLTVLLASCVALPAISALAQDQTLSTEEQAALAELNGETAAQIAAIAAEIDNWQTTYDVLRGRIGQISAATDANATVDAETAGALRELYGQVVQLLPRVETVSVFAEAAKATRQRMSEFEQAARKLKYDADQAAGKSEAQWRAEAEDAIRARMSAKLMESVARLLDTFQELRDPAQFMNRFLEEELRKQYFDKPYPVGDVTFTIVAASVTGTKSVFSPEANLGVRLEYQKGVSLSATGLYFEYAPGQPLPVPKLDRMQVNDSELRALAGSALTSLGDLIPADLGLPIQLKNVRFNGFGGEAAGKPGSLSFDLEIGGFLEFAKSLAFRATGVTIETNGKVTLAEGLTFEDATTKVAVGTTGLLFDGYAVTLNPQSKDETLVLATHLASVAGGKDSVSLDLTARLGFPVDPAKGIKFEGVMRIGGKQGEAVGKCEAAISSQRITGWLHVPEGGQLPLQNILEARFDFELNEQGFTANGMAALFGAIRSQVDMALRFDGSGHLAARDDFQISGVNVGATLLVEVQQGFRQVDLKADLAVNVDLKLFRADAAIAVEASSRDRIIHVVATTMGATAEFEVDSLEAITPPLIAVELLKQMDDILGNIAVAAAQWETDKRALLANWENHWRDSLHNEAKKLGLDKVSTGDPNVDRMLGDISRDGKRGGQWVSDVWKNAGAEASETIKNPGEKLQGLPGAVGKDLENLGNTVTDGLSNVADSVGLGSLFGGGGGGDRPSGPSEAEKRAAELHRKVEEKLKPITLAANRVRVVRKPAAPDARQRSGRFAAKNTELYVTFDNSVGASEGDGNGALGLTVAATGLRSRIAATPNGQNERQSSSDVKAAWVEFTALVAKADPPAKPTARIFVNPLADASGQDATTLARHELQNLVERYLPEVEIEGRKKYRESQLAVQNDTDEPVLVAVQLRTRRFNGSAHEWSWSPAEPGKSTALRFKIPARTPQPVLLRFEDALDRDTEEGAAETGPLHASRARIWAESESGQTWDDYRDRDLWLVQENAALGGERAYDAEHYQTHVYGIQPKDSIRTLTERVLAFRNDSTEPLSVRLRYRSRKDGSVRWSTARFDVAPRQTIQPRDEDGFRMRASRICFVAESENRKYQRFQTEPLWTVDQTNGQRTYRAKQIGTFIYTFQPVDAEAKKRVAEVIADRAAVKKGTETLATLEKGSSITLKSSRGEWFSVETTVNGTPVSGWVHQRDLRVTTPAPAAAPAQKTPGTVP